MNQSKMCFSYVPIIARRVIPRSNYEFDVSFDALIEKFGLSEEDLNPSPETHLFVVCSIPGFPLTAHISTQPKTKKRIYSFFVQIAIDQSERGITTTNIADIRLGLLVIEGG